MKDTLLRVGKNTVFISIEKVIEVLASIATVAIVARYLSIELVGQYIFIVTVVGFLLMGSFAGLERILIRNISREKERTNDYLRGAITARNIMFVSILVLLSMLLFFMHFDKTSLIATGIFIISEFLSYQGLTYMAIFKAYERMEYNTVITFVTKIITLGATALAVYLDLGFISVFLAITAGNLFKSITSFSLFKKLKLSGPTIRNSISNPWKELLRESYIIVLTTILAVVCVRMEVFILKAFSTLKDVALFQVSHNIIMQFQVIPMAAISALAPMLSREASFVKGINKNLIEKLLTVLLCVGFPITILGFYCASDIIYFIYGVKYLQAATSLRILICSSVFIILFYLFETLLVSINRQNYIGYGWMVCFAINLILGLLLVPFIGYIGASIAVTFAYIGLCVFLYFSLIWFMPIKISMRAILKVFTSASVMIVYLSLFPINTNNSTTLVLVNVFIAILLYLGTYFAWNLFIKKTCIVKGLVFPQ
ncbi:MAG TPA: flippase [Candidatus Wunengus sp. YC61]|uniref:flippase n=1 Tax=Candidatus Wunengus sp. YC61 TaxID=3367698 RepID=UPI00402A0015